MDHADDLALRVHVGHSPLPPARHESAQ
jgi:hypothetical protein